MFTLVPTQFFEPLRQRAALAEVAKVSEDVIVKHIEIPQYNAVLVYEVDEDSVISIPEMANILQKLPDCNEYNKILCSFKEGHLFIAIAQGKTLLLANSYNAPDFTTAEYYIFLTVKSQQLNPELSTICFLTPLSQEEEMSLYRYFKSVVKP
ncbi:MAG: DUF3822 family protein [Bacteroidales bacterium]|nr:DUF3822 family protein [Bacteroidales bacterium]